jgi:exopolysaccharide production protein ExoQ
MPKIALILSLAFSTYLIVRDCRRRRDVSIAIWIPTIFVMILSSRPASLWLSGRAARLGIENANDQATSMIDQLFYLISLGSSFVIASARGMKWGKLFSSNRAILLFYLYFALSILWSSDPSGSTKRLIKDFGVISLAALIFTEKDPLQSLRAVYLRSAYLLLPLSVVFIKWFPGLGRAYGSGGEMNFTGVTTQKNSLGEVVMIFTLFLIWDYLETRSVTKKSSVMRLPWYLIILLLNGAWLLNISQSKSGLVCSAVGVFLCVRSGRLLSKFVNRLAMAGALSLPIVVFFAQKFSEVIAPLLHALGRDLTFTGRAEIWTNITLETVNPVYGYGFWNFWGGPGGTRVNETMHSVIPNAHNGYIDMYLDGGFIALAILCFMLIVCGHRMGKFLRVGRDPTRFHRVRFAILIILIIYNVSESAFGRMGPIWFTSLVLIWTFPANSTKVAKVKSHARRRVESAFDHVPTLVMSR